MARGKLTAATVGTVRPRGRDGKPRNDGEVSDEQDGLFLVVYPSGKRAYAVRYRNAAGKPRKITLGQIDDITLKDARAEAKALQVRIGAGEDPAAKPDKDMHASGGITVAAAVERFLEQKQNKRGEPLRDRTKGEYRWMLEKHLTVPHGARALAEITGAEIHDMVASCSTAAAGNSLHRTMSSFFAWCARRPGGLIDVNPYSGAKLPNVAKRRKRVLSWSEVADLWDATEGGPLPFTAIVRVLLLTGQRKEEVSAMQRKEIDRNRSLWTLPDARTKNGEAHTVHLTALALAEIDRAPKRGDAGFVFTSDGEHSYAGHKNAKRGLDKRLAFNEKWTLHDLRRTFRTGLTELGFPVDVAEAAINHLSGSQAGLVGNYNAHRYEEDTRDAMIAWSRFIVDVVTDEPVRLAYERLPSKRRFREAIRDRAPRWRRMVELLRRWQRYTEHMQRVRETEAMAA